MELIDLTDLPLIAAQSAPRPIHIAGAVDATDTRVPISELAKVYHSENVKLLETADWNETALGGI
jgi:hypothetical protein